MQRLDRRPADRGAVAIVVVVLLIALFGFGAMVIDLGALYQERSEVQTGADAAAVALALDCVILDTTSMCTDNAHTRAQAQFFADANASDSEIDASGIVTSSGSEVIDVAFNNTTQTVVVEIGTFDTSDSDGEIEFALAPVIGSGSARVEATATASWGVPIDIAMVPFGIGLCEWEDGTTFGTDFEEDQTLFLRHLVSLPLLCSGGPSGGFGYLETNGDCTADIDDGYVQGQTLLTNPLTTLGCLAGDLAESQLYIPVFDDVDGTTPDPPCDSLLEPCYQIHGYAVFEVDPGGVNDFDLDLTGLLPPIPPPVVLDDLLGVLPSLTGRFVEYVELDYLGEIDTELPDLGLHTLRLSD